METEYGDEEMKSDQTRKAALDCPFCGKKPIIGLGKKEGCSLHGEPMQSVTVSCSCEFHPSISAGDIYNGGKFEAQQEAITRWNKRALQSQPVMVGELVEALEKIINRHYMTTENEIDAIARQALAKYKEQGK